MSAALAIIIILLALAFCVGLVLVVIEVRRVTRRPNPFGGLAHDTRSKCPHCGLTIWADDVIRSVSVIDESNATQEVWTFVEMHEHCARAHHRERLVASVKP